MNEGWETVRLSLRSVFLAKDNDSLGGYLKKLSRFGKTSIELDCSVMVDTMVGETVSIKIGGSFLVHANGVETSGLDAQVLVEVDSTKCFSMG